MSAWLMRLCLAVSIKYYGNRRLQRLIMFPIRKFGCLINVMVVNLEIISFYRGFTEN